MTYRQDDYAASEVFWVDDRGRAELEAAEWLPEDQPGPDEIHLHGLDIRPRRDSEDGAA